MKNIESQIMDDHMDNLVHVFSEDFLKQIGYKLKKSECPFETITNDLDLSMKFNWYLIKQLSGFFPVIIDNEN